MAENTQAKWYVVHTYSGYENKVKTNLEKRIESMNMEEYIFRIMIPTEDVEEKKMIVTVMTKSVKFDGENLIVNLKDTFKALQNVKKCVLETSENDNLRTHETLANIKKDPHSEGLFVNGARNGLHLEPIFLLYNITKLDECQELIDNFYNLVA